MTSFIENLNTKSKKATKSFIYDKVDNNKRIELLRLLKEEHKTLKEAAEILKINYSTAKTIIRVYRKENRIHKKSYLKDLRGYSTSSHSQEENEIKDEEKVNVINTPTPKISEDKTNMFLKRKLNRDMETCSKMLSDAYNQILANKNMLMNLYLISSMFNKSTDMYYIN